MEADQEWRIEPDDRQAVIEIPSASSGYDISTVFERMPRSRIERIEVEQESLNVLLNCNCSIEYEQRSDGLLIFDVLDPALPNVVEALDDEVQSLNGAYKSSFEEKVQASNWISAERSQDPNLKLLKFLESSELEDSASRVEAPPASVEKEQDIKLMLSTNGHTIDNGSEFTEKNRYRVFDAGRSRRSGGSPKIEKSYCNDNVDFELSTMVYEGSFSEVASNLRKNLYGDLDEISIKSATELMKFYLFHGMIEEAFYISQGFDRLAPEVGYLRSISEILSGEVVESESVGYEYFNCDGESQLWRALNDKGTLQETDAQKLISLYLDLPIQVQEILVAPLRNLLERIHDAESIDVLTSSMRRQGVVPFPSASNLEASQSSDQTNGIETLRQLAFSNQPDAPEALREYLDASVSAGFEVSDQALELAATYIGLTENVSSSNDLRNTLLEVFLTQGEVDKAYSLTVDSIESSDRLDGTKVFELLKLLRDNDSSSMFVELIWRLIHSNFENEFTPSQLIDLISILDSIGYRSLSSLLSEMVDTEKFETVDITSSNKRGFENLNVETFSGSEQVSGEIVLTDQNGFNVNERREDAGLEDELVERRAESEASQPVTAARKRLLKAIELRSNLAEKFFDE